MNSEVRQIEMVAILVGSDSDIPKIQACIDHVRGSGIFTSVQIKSIHRTPDRMEHFTAIYPDLAPSIRKIMTDVAGDVEPILSVVIAAAGGAAHLPWGIATHAPQAVVIALPVSSSTMGNMDSLFSMLNMPPEVPNGVAYTPEIAWRMAEKIIKMDVPEGYNKISIPETFQKHIPPGLLEEMWLELDEKSPIKIAFNPLVNKAMIPVSDTDIHIGVPLLPYGPFNPNQFPNLHLIMNQEALFMGFQNSQNINLTNAILFAAHKTLRWKLLDRRRKVGEVVAEKDDTLQSRDAKITAQQMKLITSWLWPASKKMDLREGNPELEQLGYVCFYRWKNADVYVIPDTSPIEILMVRSDRTSVFNIPLDLQIAGKWAIQNQISYFWAQFAEQHGVRTIVKTLPDNIPTSLKDRCQRVELCKQLEVEVAGQKQGLELIFRNYITGTLYKAYSKWENPYEIDLPANLWEWADIRIDGKARFTPTDKTKNDNPIPSHIVENWLSEAGYGDIVPKLQQLFADFTAFAYERGYVVVDTKFEVFVDANGQWVLWDEILTPESSRFIKKEDFEAGNYISADKQLIRNIWKAFWWEQKWGELKKAHPKTLFLPVADTIGDDQKSQVVQWYSDILAALTRDR
jgi:phosphoribosylaminoimidazole-succinocarboxamide synthase